MSVWPGIKKRIEYNGKVILFFADIDGFCWINDDSTVFEDGTPVTTEDLMEFLRFYGKDAVKPIEQRTIKDLPIFFDGNEEFGNGGYGDTIRIDKDGNPLVTIKDGKIISSYVMCSCEEQFQYGNGGFHARSQEEFDAKIKTLTDSGDFIEIRKGKPRKEGIFRTYKGETYLFKCTKCGAVWNLPAYVKPKDKKNAHLPVRYNLYRTVYVTLKDDKDRNPID